MKRNRSPTSKNVTLCSSFGSRSVLVRFSFGSRSVLDRFSFDSRSVLVRFSFGSRSILDRFSFILRSSSVHSPFILRSGIEDRSKNERRIIGGKTEMYRNSNGKPREGDPNKNFIICSYAA